MDENDFPRAGTLDLRRHQIPSRKKKTYNSNSFSY